MEEVYSMRMDPRCRHLNELSDHYHILFRQLAEGYLARLCEETKYPETMCFGDYLMLFDIGENDSKVVHMADISKHLNINPSTATRRVNRLLANGLVTKCAALNDDRCYDLGLTDEGQMLLDRMDSLLYNAVQYVYEPVTDDEMQSVYNYLDKSIGQLKKLMEKEAG